MEEPPKHPDVARIFTQLLDAVGMNAAQFARKIGSTPQAVSNYMVGRNEPGRKMLALIIEAYPNIDASWLATGMGEPFPNGKFSQLPPAVPSEAKPHREGFPATPGTATPKEADFVGRVIRDLEKQIADYQAREAWYQEMLKKPLASADAAAFMTAVPSMPRIGFQTTARTTECRVLPFVAYVPQPAKQQAA